MSRTAQWAAAALVACLATSPAIAAGKIGPRGKRAAPRMTAEQYQQWLEYQRHVGPVECFAAAKERTYLTDAQAERLCRCRHSAAAVDCFLDAKTRTFLDDEAALRLCSTGEFAPLGCLD